MGSIFVSERVQILNPIFYPLMWAMFWKNPCIPFLSMRCLCHGELGSPYGMGKYISLTNISKDIRVTRNDFYPWACNIYQWLYALLVWRLDHGYLPLITCIIFSHTQIQNWMFLVTTLFSCMVVFYSIFSIWHGAPRSYLHGKKHRK